MAGRGKIRRQAGFSLVEVVLAIGIVAFAVVAIVGLFPVGYRAALESRRATRAAYLAEQLIGDLRASAFTNASILYGTDSLTPSRCPVDLLQTGTYFLASDASNTPTTVLTNQADYQNGVADPAISYLACVTVTPDATFTNLSHIGVEVSAPAGIPLASRSRYGVMTLIGPR